jgi:hypothetical protein
MAKKKKKATRRPKPKMKKQTMPMTGDNSIAGGMGLGQSQMTPAMRKQMMQLLKGKKRKP